MTGFNRIFYAIIMLSALIRCPAFAACISTGTTLAPERGNVLEKGFNFTGWMENPNAATPDTDVLGTLKKAGFTHIRLPVNGSLLMPSFASEQTRQTMLERLDATLSVLVTMGYAVSLDMHPDARFANLHQTQPATALSQLKNTWAMLAQRYVSYSNTALFFEMLNEPVVNNSLWRTQVEELVNYLRIFAPTRTFIVGAAGGQRIDDLAQWTPLADTNIVYAVHFYDPMIFTHQGLTWEPDNPIRLLHDVPFPVNITHPGMVALLKELNATGHSDYARELKAGLAEPWGEANVAEAFNQLHRWRSQHQRAVIVNEFGVLKTVAPSADRAEWIHLVAGEAKRVCAGWAHWDFNQGFGLLNKEGQPDPVIMNALMTP
jgi:endoglucanase